MPTTLPIREPDETIRTSLADAHFPSIAGAVAHLTGDTAVLRIRPPECPQPLAP